MAAQDALLLLGYGIYDETLGVIQCILNIELQGQEDSDLYVFSKSFLLICVFWLFMMAVH